MLLFVLLGVLVNAAVRSTAFPAGPGKLSLVLSCLNETDSRPCPHAKDAPDLARSSLQQPTTPPLNPSPGPKSATYAFTLLRVSQSSPFAPLRLRGLTGPPDRIDEMVLRYSNEVLTNDGEHESADNSLTSLTPWLGPHRIGSRCLHQRRLQEGRRRPPVLLHRALLPVRSKQCQYR